MKITKDLVNIVCVSLVSLNLNCYGQLIKDNQDDDICDINEVKNENLVPIGLNNKVYFLYKTPSGNYDYALEFLKNGNNKTQEKVDIYKIERYEDTMKIGNKPDFSLIDLDGDKNYDIGLRFNGINNDTIKPAFIYLKLIR